jgi:hypothetical protein
VEAGKELFLLINHDSQNKMVYGLTYGMGNLFTSLCSECIGYICMGIYYLVCHLTQLNEQMMSPIVSLFLAYVIGRSVLNT